MMAKKGMAAEEPSTTITSLFENAVKTKGDKIALRTERPCPPLVDGVAGPVIPLQEWKSWTIAEYYAECRNAAKAFIGLGMGEMAWVG